MFFLIALVYRHFVSSVCEHVDYIINMFSTVKDIYLELDMIYAF